MQISIIKMDAGEFPEEHYATLGWVVEEYIRAEQRGASMGGLIEYLEKRLNYRFEEKELKEIYSRSASGARLDDEIEDARIGCYEPLEMQEKKETGRVSFYAIKDKIKEEKVSDEEGVYKRVVDAAS